MPAAENQEQQVTPLGGDAQGLFELILDGVPLLKDSDVKQKLLQWCVFQLRVWSHCVELPG